MHLTHISSSRCTCYIPSDWGIQLHKLHYILEPLHVTTFPIFLLQNLHLLHSRSSTRFCYIMCSTCTWYIHEAEHALATFMKQNLYLLHSWRRTCTCYVHGAEHAPAKFRGAEHVPDTFVLHNAFLLVTAFMEQYMHRLHSWKAAIMSCICTCYTHIAVQAYQHMEKNMQVLHYFNSTYKQCYFSSTYTCCSYGAAYECALLMEHLPPPPPPFLAPVQFLELLKMHNYQRTTTILQSSLWSKRLWILIN